MTAGNDTGQEAWGRVAARAVNDDKLTGSHLRLLIWFACRWPCSKIDWRPFSLVEIASATGISRQSLPPLIADLVERHYIDKRCGNPNEYLLTLAGCTSRPEATPSRPEATPDSRPEATATSRPEATPLFICEEEIKERKRAPPGGGATRAHATPATQNNGAQNGSSRPGRLPADWQLTAADTEYALIRWLDPAEIATDFCDHYLGTGHKTTSPDWSRTWRRWCREEVKRRQRPRGPVRENPEDRLKRRLNNIRNQFAPEHYAAMGNGDPGIPPFAGD
jgi:hypothetical protein